MELLGWLCANSFSGSAEGVGLFKLKRLFDGAVVAGVVEKALLEVDVVEDNPNKGLGLSALSLTADELVGADSETDCLAGEPKGLLSLLLNEKPGFGVSDCVDAGLAPNMPAKGL